MASKKKQSDANAEQIFTPGLAVYVYIDSDDSKRPSLAAAARLSSYEEDIPEERFYTAVIDSVNEQSRQATVIRDKDQAVRFVVTCEKH